MCNTLLRRYVTFAFEISSRLEACVAPSARVLPCIRANTTVDLTDALGGMNSPRV